METLIELLKKELAFNTYLEGSVLKVESLDTTGKGDLERSVMTAEVTEDDKALRVTATLSNGVELAFYGDAEDVVYYLVTTNEGAGN